MKTFIKKYLKKSILFLLIGFLLVSCGAGFIDAKFLKLGANDSLDIINVSGKVN